MMKTTMMMMTMVTIALSLTKVVLCGVSIITTFLINPSTFVKES